MAYEFFSHSLIKLSLLTSAFLPCSLSTKYILGTKLISKSILKKSRKENTNNIEKNLEIALEIVVGIDCYCVECMCSMRQILANA